MFYKYFFFTLFNIPLLASCTTITFSPVAEDTSIGYSTDSEDEQSTDSGSEPGACAANPCPVNSTCEASIDGFDCSCNDGWYENGTDCVDRDECLQDQDTSCKFDNSICVNFEGGYKCDCEEGFWLNENGDACIPSNRYSQVAVGEAFTCALQEDGKVSCFGYNNRGQSTPPNGEFQTISAGLKHACGLSKDGQILCWGDNSDGKTVPQEDTTYSLLSVDGDRSCGLREDNAVVCWGKNAQVYTVEDAVPTYTDDTVFVQLDTGPNHACGLTDSGEAVCWGRIDDAETALPSIDNIREIGTSEKYTCIVSDNLDPQVHCIGNKTDIDIDIDQVFENSEIIQEEKRVGSLVVKEEDVCWVMKQDGVVLCVNSKCKPPLKGDGYSRVDVGPNHVCGVTDKSIVKCVGDNNVGQAFLLRGGFSEVSTRQRSVCGLTFDGSVYCFGDLEETTPLKNGYKQIVTGDKYACGINKEGTVDCWGEHMFFIPPDKDFVQIDIGNNDKGFGLTEDGKIISFKGTDTESADALKNKYSAISVGNNFSCALTTKDHPECWGMDYIKNDIVVNENIYLVSLDVGDEHVCGVTEDATAICWGRASNEGNGEELNPPDGKFDRVACGKSYSCGIRKGDKSIVCWGSTENGEMTPPTGKFNDISASDTFICAVGVNGNISCWGSISR